MSRIPDFSKVAFDGLQAGPAPTATKTKADWRTNEQIPVKSLYTADDTSDLEHTDFVARVPPFLPGPCATVHVPRRRTVRQ